MGTSYERIYPPDYIDYYNPECPDCGERMFYVGVAQYFKEDTQFNKAIDKTALVDRKIYQCSSCKSLFKEIKEDSNG